MATQRLTRLTVSLPEALVEEVDRLLAQGSNRSAAVRQALQEAVDEARRREDSERYRRGYAEQPETEEEFGWLDAANLEFWTKYDAK